MVAADGKLGSSHRTSLSPSAGNIRELPLGRWDTQQRFITEASSIMSSEEAASAAVCEAAPPQSEVEPLRMVLLGRTGTGRSSTGNTIFGGSAFWADASPCSVTTHCQRKTQTVDGRSLTVVDTPGFLHTELSPEEVMAEVGRSVGLCSPGPHAFLVTLRPGRFTQEEREALEWLRATFGPRAGDFTMVLFTCGDQLHGKPIQNFLEESQELSEFVRGCRGGYHLFDNSENKTKHPQQVTQLLEKIDKMVAENGGGCYGDEMLTEAESAIRQAQERILGERGRAVESPKKQVTGKDGRKEEEEEEEEARRRAERLFWSELLVAVGKGAAEGAGLMGKDKGKGKAVKKVKVVEKAAALAASPLSIRSAARVVEGAVREGGKVLYKHRKTLLR